jgi:hypothetical protein
VTLPEQLYSMAGTVGEQKAKVKNTKPRSAESVQKEMRPALTPSLEPERGAVGLEMPLG